MTDDQLRGWKEIAAFLQTSERTAQRWERELELPVHRLGSQTNRMVFALRHELVAWRRSSAGSRAAREAGDFGPQAATSPESGGEEVPVRGAADRPQLEPTSSDSLRSETVAAGVEEPAPALIPRPVSPWRSGRRTAFLVLVLAALSITAAMVAFNAFRERAPGVGATPGTLQPGAKTGKAVTLRLTMGRDRPNRVTVLDGETVVVDAGGSKVHIAVRRSADSLRVDLTEEQAGLSAGTPKLVPMGVTKLRPGARITLNGPRPLTIEWIQ
jgi:hypothetical protein